ncbi:MAG: septum formation initiator family protein [Bacteroidales bacterium]
MSIKEKIKIPAFLKKKYMIVILGIIILSIFIDRNNVIILVSDYIKVYKQENQIQDLKENINNQESRLKELTSNKDSLEKFARETYYFHEKDEDIFILDDELFKSNKK